MAVYTGSTAATLTVASNRGWSGDAARVTFDVVAGVAYRIAIDTVAVGANGLTLRWASGPHRPTTTSRRETARGDRGSVTGTTVGADAETGEPAHMGAHPAASSVWYRWTAGASGTATIHIDDG